MNTVDVPVVLEVRTTAARWWLGTCRILRFLVGSRRAACWGVRGAWRLSKWRIKGMTGWHRMDPDLCPEPIDIGPVPEKPTED